MQRNASLLQKSRSKKPQVLTLPTYISKHISRVLIFALNLFRLCETLSVINSVTIIFLIKMLLKFGTIKCWSTLYLHMHV